MSERTLVINIIGDDASARRAFAGTGTAAAAAARQVDAAGKTVESTGTRIESAGRRMQSVGGGLSKYVSLPLIGVGAAAVKMGLDFDKTMLLVETHTESSRKEVAQYKREILEMAESGKYTQGPQELGEALYHIVSDGYHGQKAIDALKQSADLAMLGQSELAETTYAVVSAMKTGIKGTEDLHETIGVLNGTMGAGDTKMGELTAALSTGVVPAAKEAGLELTDVGAAMAFLTARGIPAQKAAYGLAMNFQQLVPYTDKAKEAFERAGLPLDELAKKAEEGPEGWLHALEDLQQHLAGLSKYERREVIESIFGGGRTSRAVLAQIQNLKDLGATYERVGVIQGRTDKNLTKAREAEANQWKEEWAQAQAVLVELGNEITPVLLPLLEEVAHDVEDVVKLFDELPSGVQGWVVTLGVAAAALGPVVKTVGLIATGVAKATKAFEGMAAAETVAGAAGTEAAAGGAAARGVAAGEAAGMGAATGAGAARWLGTDAAPEATATAAMTEAEAVGASGLFGGLGSGAIAGAAGSALGAAGALAGGYFAAEFGAHAIEGITGEDLLENQDLRTSLTHGFNTSRVKATEEKALKMVAAQEEGVHPRLGLHTQERKELEADFRATMASLAGSGAAGMKAVDQELELGLKEADRVWSTGTKPWRAHTAQAMEGAVDAIRDGIHAGTINAEAGQKQINKLLREIHLVKGDDPFGLAEATAQSFKQAGGITASGVKQWAQELAMMPAAARRSSIDSTNEMLAAWAQGHPKIEREIESLTRFEVTHFGATNKQLREGVKKGATGPVAEAFQEAAVGIGGALENIGTNTSDLLRALGLHDVVEFQALVLGPSRLAPTTGPQGGEAKHHEVPGTYHGPGRQGKAGGGAITRVPGAGLDDTVPLFVNGAMSAIVAPGEDLAAITRHQRPLLDMAVANTFGVNGLWDFFDKFDRPHFAARGGEVKVKGPGVLADIGHGALAKAVKGANEYIARHEPRGPAVGAGAGAYKGKLPAGVGSFEGVPVDLWIIPILKWAKAHGWDGSVTSGYRTPEEQMAAAEAYGLGHYGPAGPLGSNHVKTAYPGGAVDVSDPAGLAAVLARYPRRPNLVWGGPVMGDEVHFSATGHARGGHVAGARGLPLSKPGQAVQDLMGSVWPAAAPFYGRSPKSPMPPANLDTSAYGGAFVGDVKVYGPHGGLRKNYLAYPTWFEAWLRTKPNVVKENLLHEWAHYFQRPMATNWEAEGGAEAFARQAAPQVYRAAGIQYQNPPFGKHETYFPFVQRVLKEKGLGWVERGQFKAKGGRIVSGKVSWFNGGATAGGGNTSQPGIALNLDPGSDSGWDNPTTEGWMEDARAGHPVYAAVSIAGHSANLPIIDLGPSGFTGRAIDVTEGGVEKLGFTTSNFPTDAVGRALIMTGAGAAEGPSGSSTRKERHDEEKQQAVGPGLAISAAPLHAGSLPKSAHGLPSAAKHELRAPGLTYSDKVGIAKSALSQTKATLAKARQQGEQLRSNAGQLQEQGDFGGAEDLFAKADQLEAKAIKEEEAVLDYERDLFEGRRKQVKKLLSQLEKQAKNVPNPAKQKKLLGRMKALREELSSLQSALRGLQGTGAELHEASEGFGELHLPEGWGANIGSEVEEKVAAAVQEEKERPRLEAELALANAELTPDTSDDRAAQERLVQIAEEELWTAKSTPSLLDDIEAAHNLKAAREALEQMSGDKELKEAIEELTKTLQQQQRNEEASEAISSREALKALADVIANQLSPQVFRGGLATGIGKVGSS